MSTKPTVLPRWADVGGDIVEPSSGKKDIGWVAGERPAAEYFNWLLNVNYLWAEYLSDGAFTGDFSFDSISIPNYAFYHGTKVTHMSAAIAQGSIPFSPTSYYLIATGAQTSIFPLLIPQDSTLTEVSVNFDRQGVDVTVALERLNAAGTPTTLATTTDTTSSGPTSITHAVSEAVVLGGFFHIRVTTAGANPLIFNARMKYTRVAP